MASILQVEMALVNFIAGLVYPNGLTNPSIISKGVQINAGFPSKKEIDESVKQDLHVINVYTMPNVKNITRYDKEWQHISLENAGLNFVVNNNEITITGTPFELHNVKVVVNKTNYVYTIKHNDTVEDIVLGLADLIPNSVANNNVLTINGDVYSLTADESSVWLCYREVLRQKSLFSISILCPSLLKESKANRDILGDAIIQGLSGVTHIDLPDGSGGYIVFVRSFDDDFVQTHQLIRRFIFYTVEYPTTILAKFNGITHVTIQNNVLTN